MEDLKIVLDPLNSSSPSIVDMSLNVEVSFFDLAPLGKVKGVSKVVDKDRYTLTFVFGKAFDLQECLSLAQKAVYEQYVGLENLNDQMISEKEVNP